MSITQVSDDRLSYKFATTLIFTNGRCPFCKERIYELNEDGLSMKVGVEKAKNHYPRHKEEYKRSIAILGSMGMHL